MWISCLRPDDEGRAGGLGHLRGDRPQPADLQHAPDLGEQPLHRPEVAAGDPGDRRQRLGIGPVVRRKGQSDLPPLVGEDEAEFVAAQGPDVADEADPRGELGVPGRALLDPRQPDQDDADAVGEGGPVVAVAEPLQLWQLEAVGLVDDRALRVR